MFLSKILIQIAIIAGAVLLFLVTYILNKRTKAPKIDETIEKCKSCENQSCMIKLSEIETIKLEYKKELEKHLKEKNQDLNQSLDNEPDSIYNTITRCNSGETNNKGEDKDEK